ncbi:Crp/Fnr family transcriptional regulator [Paenibacillus sp. GD4]|jgi:CRP/FNR family transcriptional regulator, cyclic AMP receptor protein|uniref:Crp/Fnr family transcriptional regulator n=1 Tax=Paenibacillus TaxID=44249 RepID=UPI0025436EC3|nr:MULTISPECIES: Crp/Fnr family transcriptional regulator [Paenibacillus]MDQ1913196.1 Crp/Fnr family transcriptional regulator [Paenibacillus sp. GD4]
MLLHKGETLFRQGETGPLFRIQSGLLKIVRVNEEGHPFLFNIIVPGEMIPHHSLMTPKDYHGTAIALMTTEVERVSPKEWYEELERNPEKYREVALLLQSKLRMMQLRIDQLTQVTPAEKLGQLRSWFAEYLSPDVSLTDVLTQEEIGQLIGIRRETVNRLLRADRA